MTPNRGVKTTQTKLNISLNGKHLSGFFVGDSVAEMSAKLLRNGPDKNDSNNGNEHRC